MVDSLCQSYHWSFRDTLRLTLPQMIMVNHAAHVNHLRVEARVKSKQVARDKESQMWHGKHISELNTDEYLSYLSSEME